MLNIDNIQQFKQAMVDAGLQPPDDITPEKIHRFPGIGKKRGNQDGWCRLFGDMRGGVFGDWPSGFDGKWQANSEHTYTSEERKAFHRRIEEERKARDAEQLHAFNDAAEKAGLMLENVRAGSEHHRYTKDKKLVLCSQIKRGAWNQRNWLDALLIPLFDIDGRLWSVQAINPSGEKDFLKGGRKRGCFYPFGDLRGASRVLIGEGVATVSVTHAVDGSPAVAAMDSGNLLPVAAEVRKIAPNAEIIFLADNDIKPNGSNPGVKAATEAARSVGGSVAIPELGGRKCDFWDVWNEGGDCAVREALFNLVTEKSQSVPEANPMDTLPTVDPVYTKAPDHLASGHQAQEMATQSKQDGLVETSDPTEALDECSKKDVGFKKPELIGVDVRDGTEKTRPLTEAGNALRINDKHGDVIRYVPEAKAWLHWTHGAWLFDIDGARITSLAMAMASEIYIEGVNYLADSVHFVKWARKSQESKTINASISLLKNFESLRVPMAVIDADQFLIGVGNATSVVDLRTGLSRPASQVDLVTKSANVCQLGDPKKAIRWLQFLDQVFDGDTEVIDWLKRFCGYLLTGSTKEQFFLFCYGQGANGKSVFAEILKHILGDYARAVQVESLCETRRSAGSATPDIAALIGARLALSTETEDGAALAESLVKALVSGDSMTARNLHKDPVEFSPQFKLLMLGNHKPMVRGNDNGIWRRIRLLPFVMTFSDGERDPDLIQKLKKEAEHIFAWMVEGCLEWGECGLSDIPRVIRQATEEYREDQDVIGQWIDECCSVSPSLESSTDALYASHRDWAIKNGFRPSTRNALGRRLGDKGFSGRKSHGRMVREGISVKTSNYGRLSSSSGG